MAAAVRLRLQPFLLRRLLPIGYRGGYDMCTYTYAPPQTAHAAALGQGPRRRLTTRAAAPIVPTSTSASASAPTALLLLLALGAAAAPAAAATADDAHQSEAVAAAAEHAPYLERIDARLHRAYPEFMEEHLIHQTLSGEEKIEDLRLYRDSRDGSIVAFTRLGRLLSGHPGVVHGGTLAAILDNTFGVAFFGAKVGNGFTANLTVNYRKPVTVGTEVKVLARVKKVEGRKVFLVGQIRDARDDSVLYTEATCLFVTSTSGLLRRQSALNIG